MPTNPNPDIPGMIFSREGMAAALRDSYQLVAGEVEALAQLAGGTEPDDDLSEAIAFLARAMGSLTNSRRAALQEWAADGGDACFSEAELDKLLGALGKIAREEPREPGFDHLEGDHASGCQRFACVTAAPASIEPRFDHVETNHLYKAFDSADTLPEPEQNETHGRMYGPFGYEKTATNFNCPLKSGSGPCQCDLPRCPDCGYTSYDAGDHARCGGPIPAFSTPSLANGSTDGVDALEEKP